jgi:hypothetical protein
MWGPGVHSGGTIVLPLLFISYDCGVADAIIEAWDHH